MPGGVNSLLTDETGIRWVATPNGFTGIDYSHLNSSFLPLVYSSGKEGINNMIGVCYEEEEDKYFVCSVKPAAVFIINRKTGKIGKITRDHSGNLLPPCFAIKKDISNRLWLLTCLLYTSDAADERSSVDLGGRRIIKKKKNRT